MLWDKYQWWVEYAVWGKVWEILGPLSSPLLWRALFLLLFSCQVMSDSLGPHGLQACQAPLSSTISQSLLKIMSIESVMLSNHLILCCPLLLLPSIFPSIRVFSNESALCIRWPKHWSFSFSMSPSNEYLGLISFRIDWFGLLASQENFKSLLHYFSWDLRLLLWRSGNREASTLYLSKEVMSWLQEQKIVFLQSLTGLPL